MENAEFVGSVSCKPIVTIRGSRAEVERLRDTLNRALDVGHAEEPDPFQGLGLVEVFVTD